MTALAIHPQSKAPCPKHLQELSHAFTHSPQLQFHGPTIYRLEVARTPLTRILLRSASLEREKHAETWLRARTSHHFPTRESTLLDIS